MADQIPCPRCHHLMLKRLVYSGWTRRLRGTGLQAMRELQAELDAGRAAERTAGPVTVIVPMVPEGTKWAACDFCPDCVLVVLSEDDVIPPADVPAIAK